MDSMAFKYCVAFKRRFGTRASLIAAVAIASVFLAGVRYAQAVVITFTAGPVLEKKVITDDVSRFRDDQPDVTSDADLPNGSVVVNIPPKSTVLLSALFTAEVDCFDDTSLGESSCRITILAAGDPMHPDDSTQFDSTFPATNDEDEEHAIERHHCFTNGTSLPVPVTVRVRWSVEETTTVFSIDNTSLAVTMYDAGFLSSGCPLG